MKIWEVIGIIATCAVIIQFVKWVLDLIGISNSIGEMLALFLAGIFVLLLIISIVLYQHSIEINRIKAYLNKLHPTKKDEK